ncbi:cytochrome c [Sideroxydans lithotrophicus]|uniref:Cytochrome c family protein n=1 Tax=Sideroxydans lithotrophicus (strain ES-1) TaxID=580332 RepID=D5CPG6_SIDLE|nr:cytochrome c [Sideroxydans lithotrophicus]ADE11107.1 cytochrome c family protein [Sideroxydans lithotrophicus ES-1]
MPIEVGMYQITAILRSIVLGSALMALPMKTQADIMVMPGNVIEGHAKLEDDCEKCHKKFDKAAQSALCADCHKEIHKDLDEKRGYHGRLDPSKQCRECHTDHKGRDAKIAEFDRGKFDHDQTDYPLKGAHLNPKVKCTGCHKAGKKYRDAPTSCDACHKKDDKHKGKLGSKCESCHIDKSWKDIQFDHDKTRFPLLGKHRDVKCEKCHNNDKFKETPTSCNSCHKKNDKHKGKLGPKCESCHIEKSWKEIRFDHDKTKFPLLGKHRDVKCEKCHSNDKFKKTPTLCNACHRKEGIKAHKGKFGTKCESCHTVRNWKEIIFDHDKETKYPLLGKHRQTKCVSCHTGDLYKQKLPAKCDACHKKDDKHKGQEGDKCESCHSEIAWTKTTFDHSLMSTFPLLGRHLLVACKKCHATPMFKGVKTDCRSCHTKDDVHKRKLGTECETCHNARDWKAWDFDHDKTSFKLDGPHKEIAGKCYVCHSAPMEKKVVAPTACDSCHDKDDVHNGSFGEHCERCHIGNDWKEIRVGVLNTRDE